MVLDHNRIAQLLEIIERNRWNVVKKKAVEEQEEEVFEESENTVDISARDVQLVLYAAESPLRDSLIAMFSKEIVITAFDDPEKIITFCCDYHTKFIMMDLDPPSDSKLALDVFSALSIMRTDIVFFACTGKINTTDKIYLIKNGVNVLEKPILRKQIQWIIDKYIKPVPKY